MISNRQTQALLIEALDALEQREARLLVWGLVDGKVGRTELEGIVDLVIDQALSVGKDVEHDAASLIQEMLALGLLHEFEDETSSLPVYRSRMAETVRLLFRLRQLFPKHEGPRNWRSAKTLVGDYRFTWRRRHYPLRESQIDVVLREIGSSITDPAVVHAATNLLEGKGANYALANFQVKSTKRILSCLEAKRSAGTLVSAGTGSGKTLAFYLPALSRICSHLVTESKPIRWVKAVAIYPRTELLRDQFMETYREARRLDSYLLGLGKRKIVIGALFGPTPRSAEDLEKTQQAGWKKTERGFICGLMACPAEGCRGDLVWPIELVKKRKEHLVCMDCGSEVTDEEVILTRSALCSKPPDILFSTTEMLNQRLADSKVRHLFGLRPKAVKAPEVVLLDEVHTYCGAHGAQVAYLLRRWSAQVAGPIHFVGLSATLRDAASFFARLTGLREGQVQEITPARSEMTSEGAEYLVALRGDPVSRSSILSTTIQASMLMSRALDTPQGTPSGGIYGNRIFDFTDDIDVVNRLFYDLLDAEGRGSDGSPDWRRHPNGSLAGLRRDLPSSQRDAYGQNWRFLRSLGHTLDRSDSKRIGRTSSQDPGVASNLDVVVATASLEVGFNDPQVGAVIQHKSPRDIAQFLQRKGRAGRSRNMRPWTLVILTDYGRDRLTYQNYDQLFDPELPRRNLPLSSRYIQRMQSVYSLIDYLGTLPDAKGVGNVWYRLATPDDHKSARDTQLWLADRLSEMLELPAAMEALEAHLGKSLGLPRESLLPLLWEFPRPLLTSAIPTAIRRLETNWKSTQELGIDFNVRNSPLPEYIPASLFSDLNLPEVSIRLVKRREDDQDQHVMPIAQAMRTFSPGRVSRRFGISHRLSRHWIASGVGENPQSELPLEQSFELSYLGNWSTHSGTDIAEWPIYRPLEIFPFEPPSNVQDSSTGRLNWNTQICVPRRGLIQTAPSSSSWKSLLTDFEIFSHNELNAVEVRRFALSGNAEIIFEKKESNFTTFNYSKDGMAAGLGYSMLVDGICFRLALPCGLWQLVAQGDVRLISTLRTSRFFDLVKSATPLSALTNIFQREWLAQIYFAAISQEALRASSSLELADRALGQGALATNPDQVLTTIFQSTAFDDTLSGDTQDNDPLREELVDLLSNPSVVGILRSCGRAALWEPLDPEWESWLQAKYKSTIAAAIYDSIQSLCPELDMTELIVDLEPGPRPPGDALSESESSSHIWITETSPGGAGLVESITRSYAEDPKRFFGLLSSSLEKNEYEAVDHQLSRLLESIAGSTPVSDLVQAVGSMRQSKTSTDASTRFAELRSELSNHGFVPFHGFISAISNRIMKPGSSGISDRFLLKALQFWEKAEQTLGVEIDARIIAYHLSQHGEAEEILNSLGLDSPQQGVDYWLFNAIYGLLWARGSQVRRASLSLYNEFASIPDSERLLVSRFLLLEGITLSVLEPDWKIQCLEALASKGAVRLMCPKAEPGQLAEALNFIATNPVQSEYLSVFAKVIKVSEDLEEYELSLEIDEVIR